MTIRFCIACGRQIGDSPVCTNPDCGKIPNFYRDVPAPGSSGWHGPRRPSAPPGETAEVPAAMPSGGTETSAEAPTASGAVPRRTVPLVRAPVAVLRAVGPRREEHAILPGPTDIGACPPARILIDRPEISARHAALDCRPSETGGWKVLLVDHGSTNGTFVNGERVDRTELRSGDKVRFANAEFEFVVLREDTPRQTVPLE